MQDVGNLVVTDGGSPVWVSGTTGSGAVRAQMQTTGT
jgi:hypothetical protein